MTLTLVFDGKIRGAMLSSSYHASRQKLNQVDLHVPKVCNKRMRAILSFCFACCFVANTVKGESPFKEKLPDKYLSELSQLETDFKNGFAAGITSRLEVEGVERLLNRAHYLHGDVTRDVFLKRSDELTEEMKQYVAAQVAAGKIQYSIGVKKEIYEASLLDHSLP